ncbi:hypothetical protein [Bradyrhizobium sp. NBAIM01]|uniref:RraA family protein n=1 Tax=Bradyrhizobium sp. NBAIM01 TaxID=2793818 RepID=UPI001CD58880|nr:hypothetical protein [Bradyrhizobium sp. NBAIM01]
MGIAAESVESIPPGHVLVIDSRNDPRAASAGAMLPTRMKVRGAAAIVTDGAFRDGQELARLDFPAYARQVTASTRLSYHRVADLNVPIACADVAVYPGDIIVGDGDGVTVVPLHLAAEMADLCERRDQLEKYCRIASRPASHSTASTRRHRPYAPTSRHGRGAGADPARATTIRAGA